MVTNTATENEKIIQQLLAEKGQGEALSESELPATVSAEHRDVVTIYDTNSGEPSQCLKSMLIQKLRARRLDGTRVFTNRDPQIKLKRGTFKCLLHADDPNRQHYDDMGLPPCKKSNIPSPYEVERHMIRSHPSAWKTIEKERIDKERQEDRTIQKTILEMVAQNKGTGLNAQELINQAVSRIKAEGGVNIIVKQKRERRHRREKSIEQPMTAN